MSVSKFYQMWMASNFITLQPYLDCYSKTLNFVDLIYSCTNESDNSHKLIGSKAKPMLNAMQKYLIWAGVEPISLT